MIELMVNSLRKISISVQLSDESEYEGGELQFYYKRDIVTAPKGRGAVIMFPSFMLHRVLSVTKGTKVFSFMDQWSPHFASFQV